MCVSAVLLVRDNISNTLLLFLHCEISHLCITCLFLLSSHSAPPYSDSPFKAVFLLRACVCVAEGTTQLLTKPLSWWCVESGGCHDVVVSEIFERAIERVTKGWQAGDQVQLVLCAFWSLGLLAWAKSNYMQCIISHHFANWVREFPKRLLLCPSWSALAKPEMQDTTAHLIAESVLVSISWLVYWQNTLHYRKSIVILLITIFLLQRMTCITIKLHSFSVKIIQKLSKQSFKTNCGESKWKSLGLDLVHSYI